MKRAKMIEALETTKDWDFIIIGGGATGLGTAIDASSRGYRTLLLEAVDFAYGTSSRSTKLIHGGVRYLQQGNISLVMEALRERGLLRNNAPHLVQDQPFVIPAYKWWERPYYGAGLKLYDLLAGQREFARSKIISREETVEKLPTVEPNGLSGGILYHDGQFDDSRLAVNMAQTASEQGAIVINHMRVEGLAKDRGKISGVIANDAESGKKYQIRSRVVINATGVFTDSVRRMDDSSANSMISPSQGVHIVLDKKFLPGDTAIMVPHTDDGRVLFAIPWYDRVLVGTTDTPVDTTQNEPTATKDELAFLLAHAGKYLQHGPKRGDIKSIFTGLRPLVTKGKGRKTSDISRDHTLSVSNSGLLTITGGKWTTYRQMAEDAVDRAVKLADLQEKSSATASLPIHGYHKETSSLGTLSQYGSDAASISRLSDANSSNGELLHNEQPTRAAEVIWAVRHEMARTVEDVLSRRTRTLLLDAKASKEMAPRVAEIMAEELGQDRTWVSAQVESFHHVADNYVADNYLMH